MNEHEQATAKAHSHGSMEMVRLCDDTRPSSVASDPSASMSSVLSGEFTKKGIQIPIMPELYNPILDELETLGFKFEEKQVS
jgi:hypothetical protein